MHDANNQEWDSPISAKYFASEKLSRKVSRAIAEKLAEKCSDIFIFTKVKYKGSTEMKT